MELDLKLQTIVRSDHTGAVFSIRGLKKSFCSQKPDSGFAGSGSRFLEMLAKKSIVGQATAEIRLIVPKTRGV